MFTSFFMMLTAFLAALPALAVLLFGFPVI